MSQRKTEWSPHLLLPWSRVTLIDGSVVRGGSVMRRHKDGAWEYRAMSLIEAEDDDERHVW